LIRSPRRSPCAQNARQVRAVWRVGLAGLACVLLGVHPSQAWAQTASTQEDVAAPISGTASEISADSAKENIPSIKAFRIPFRELMERSIGSTAKPVRFDWRNTQLHVMATGSRPAELNNFETLRTLIGVRFPIDNLILEIGAGRAFVWGTPSTSRLARTPFRQPGRPARFELNFAAGYPLAEGVVTARPGFFPAVQVVLNAYAEFRYLLYPQAFRRQTLSGVGGVLFSPRLSDKEKENLEGARLPAMEIDSGRWDLLAGLGLDVYFANGFFVSPRILLAVPLLAPATRSKLLLWTDFSLNFGWAF